MLPERDNFDNFTLDSEGYAIPWSDIQLDWLIEHGDDPLEGDPEGWPAWTDIDTFAPGQAIFPLHAFDPLPSDEDQEIPF